MKQPCLKKGAKSLLKSPNLSGDLGGSILAKLQNLRSIGVDWDAILLGARKFEKPKTLERRDISRLYILEITTKNP